MAELLEKVAGDTITAEEAINQTTAWPTATWNDRILADAWHALKHFEIDRDAFGKSVKLAQIQTKSLLRWAKLLRETT